MNIHIYGLDPRLRFCREKLLSELGGFAGDMLILPIPSTRDGKTVLGTDMGFADIIGEFSPGTVVVGYSLPREVRALISKSGMTAVDVSRDEELLLANADLTAVGTGAGTHIHHEIGLTHGIFIMLHHDQGLAQIPEAL